MQNVTILTNDPVIEKLLRYMAAELPEDPERMMELLSMADCLVETVPCYRLLCDMSHRSVEAAYEAARK